MTDAFVLFFVNVPTFMSPLLSGHDDWLKRKPDRTQARSYISCSAGCKYQSLEKTPA